MSSPESPLFVSRRLRDIVADDDYAGDDAAAPAAGCTQAEQIVLA